MKNLLALLLVTIVFSFTACNNDPIENYASRLAKITCEGERTTDMERKRELTEEYKKLEQEIKEKFKGKEHDMDAMRLYDLYFKKLQDCLGHVPVR